MNQEIDRRRTFAIISHPDAGKTTLTEKFLLFGGQIQVAGAVKYTRSPGLCRGYLPYTDSRGFGYHRGGWCKRCGDADKKVNDGLPYA